MLVHFSVENPAISGVEIVADEGDDFRQVHVDVDLGTTEPTHVAK